MHISLLLDEKLECITVSSPFLSVMCPQRKLICKSDHLNSANGLLWECLKALRMHLEWRPVEDSGLCDSHLNTVEGKVFLAYVVKFAKTYGSNMDSAI